MRERDRKTAERFGILERVEALEAKLLEIPHVVEVDFDLDGFYDGMYYVIMVPKYDVPASTPDYFQVRHEMVEDILQVARDFGLSYTGDSIEDYGEHLYVVRKCDASWKELVEQHKGLVVDECLVDTRKRSQNVENNGACSQLRANEKLEMRNA